MFGGNASLLLVLGLAWLVLFELFRDLRREQLIASLMASSLFPIVYAYTDTSTIPLGGIEHLFLLFLTGGLASVFFHIVFGQYYLRTPRHLVPARTGTQAWAWKWVALALAAVWVMVLFGFIWPTLSGGWIMFLTGLLFTLYYSISRHDLLFDAFMSAFLMLALFMMVDIVLMGTLQLSLDLYLQSAGLGLFFGPPYEFARNLRLHHVSTRI